MSKSAKDIHRMLAMGGGFLVSLRTTPREELAKARCKTRFIPAGKEFTK